MAESISSLKVAVTTVLAATSVVPSRGSTAVTVGGVVSPEGAAVVNDHVEVAARALPAESVTPPVPPSTLAVYVTELARGTEGVNVAVFVPLS